jgi:hypothetical protein
VGYPAEYLGPSEELFEELNEYPWDRQELREMCLGMPDYFSMVEAFYKRNVQERGADTWLDKCPSNIYCFDLIADRYPAARFIHVIRDARDSVLSYCRRGYPAFRAVSRWYYANLSGLQYAGWPNYFQVRYEELVRDTEAVVRRICAFIGKPYLDCMLEPEADSATPRHDGWRHAERGPIQTSSVGRFDGVTDEMKALFERISVSSYGIKLLHQRNGADPLKSPLELQEQLSYGTEGMRADSEAKPVELRRAWDDFRQYRAIMRLRHGAQIGCPVTLEGLSMEEA